MNRTLTQLKQTYLVTIYSGIVKQKSVKQIHKDLYDDTMRQKSQGLMLDKVMYNNAKKLTNKLKKEVKDEDDGLLLGIFAFKLLKKHKANEYLSQNQYNAVKDFEAKQKKEIIEDEIQYNREVKGMVFYLASEHADSADDHRDFQGKMYIDKDWRDVIKDKKLRAQVVEYVRTNNIETLQKIMHRPVWLITRPNCRHYFKAVSVEEALNLSPQSLLKKYDMKTKIGDRSVLQTTAHRLRYEGYTRENIEGVIEKYRERLALHIQMNKVQTSPLLVNAIKKDKMLINKWNSYLKYHFN